MNQSRADVLKLDEGNRSGSRARWRRSALVALLVRVAVVVVTVLLAGGSVVDAQQARKRAWSMPVAGHGFDIVGWEVNAVGEKTVAALRRPARGLAPDEASRAVAMYIERAHRIGELEAAITRLLSEGGTREGGEIATMQEELDGLRRIQQETRLQVEQIIERQVGDALADEGFTLLGHPFPPVQFAFTEPPNKLVVSPRDRIITEHSRMLDPRMSLTEIEAAEATINSGERARSYITSIGGLGAFPTMVVDRASLGWVLSTVAHEWTHNYLTLYPLGWNYFKSQELTTLNESVAEIVGNEIGAAVEERFYPPFVLQHGSAGGTAESEAGETPPVPMWEAIMEARTRFDFREEMRETRLEVDQMLADGQVEEAEAYMEARRQEFVEAGIPLRVLNQAYFAFHGSYGTSAASTSPIGPKLNELRLLMPSLEQFLNTVKWFNDVDDLDAALDEWTMRAGAAGD